MGIESMQWLQYGSFGLVCVIVIFAAKFIMQLQQSHLAQINQVAEKHEAAVKAICQSHTEVMELEAERCDKRFELVLGRAGIKQA